MRPDKSSSGSYFSPQDFMLTDDNIGTLLLVYTPSGSASGVIMGISVERMC